jgi:exodeoxyribonuclease V beta subunit
MGEHHYQLQALIYLVALHRYLRSRIQNYDYDVHVAGAAYLFLRGMQPSSPGSGVVAFTPPKALIEEMSAFFDGRFSD